MAASASSGAFARASRARAEAVGDDVHELGVEPAHHELLGGGGALLVEPVRGGLEGADVDELRLDAHALQEVLGEELVEPQPEGVEATGGREDDVVGARERVEAGGGGHLGVDDHVRVRGAEPVDERAEIARARQTHRERWRAEYHPRDAGVGAEALEVLAQLQEARWSRGEARQALRR